MLFTSGCAVAQLTEGNVATVLSDSAMSEVRSEAMGGEWCTLITTKDVSIINVIMMIKGEELGP